MENKAVRKKRDTSAKRKSIIAAAMRVFLDEGYEKASMDHISDVAAASKRTVYNHFPCKEDLLRAVLDLFGEEMRSIKNIPYESHRSLEDQLLSFIDIESSIVENSTWMGLIRLLLSVFASYPELAKEAMEKHAKTESGLTSWMRAAILDGKLDTNDHILASRVLSSMLGGAITWPAVYQGGTFTRISPELKEEIVLTFLARFGKDDGGR
jgi:TetR/AcrR family transcriptional regulator of autoinduction and epiphytic fitness